METDAKIPMPVIKQAFKEAYRRDQAYNKILTGCGLMILNMPKCKDRINLSNI